MKRQLILAAIGLVGLIALGLILSTLCCGCEDPDGDDDGDTTYTVTGETVTINPNNSGSTEVNVDQSDNRVHEDRE